MRMEMDYLMQDFVLIEVVIPVHNTEKYIYSCLSSLVNQTFNLWHATIIDDGSTDSSADICRDFCTRYSKKFSYFFKSHEGPGAARNYALDYCGINAETVYFLDSDDFIDPDMLEKMFTAMQKDNSQMAVCGYVRHIVNKRRVFNYRRSGVINGKELCVSLLEGEEIGNFSWNKLFRRDLFDNIRFSEKCFYEDVSTIYKAVLNSDKISVLQDAFYHYVWRKDSIVSNSSVGYLDDLRIAVAKRNTDIIKRFPDLKELSDINELETDIYIFNQICKKSYKSNLQYYSDSLKLINKKKYLYGKLTNKKKIMAYMISFCPELYANMVSAKKYFHL